MKTPAVSEEEDDYEDITCCHRMTICHPLIRNIIVTRPVSKHLAQSFTWAKLFQVATNAMMASIGWAVLYFILGDTMLPTNDGFGLFVLAIFSACLGSCLPLIPYLNLPPVFGMLVAGLIVRNTGLYNIHEDLGEVTTSKIRTFCLTFIMIRAGLQLSITSLKKHPIFILILAIVPCSVEMLVSAIYCKYVLSYHWDWSMLSGTILGCMSPVVTVNCLLALAEQGYGENKGFTTILSTAACIDNVHVVSLFAVCYSIVFAKDEGKSKYWHYIYVGLRDSILGMLAGTILGICFVFFPHRSHKYVNWYRITCLVLGSLTCTTAMAKFTVSGAGYLASLVMSFVSIIGWRILSTSFDTTTFRQVAFLLWRIVQPVLVGVIGADIELAHWSLSRFGLHVSCVLVGLLGRSVAAYLTTMRTPFTLKERLFVVVCWLPKGTIQLAMFRHIREYHWNEISGHMTRSAMYADMVGNAASGCMARSAIHAGISVNSRFSTTKKRFIDWILKAALGPMAYEHFRRDETDLEHVNMAVDIVRLSVVTILFLAPIGSSLITLTGPILLEHVTDEQLQRGREMSYLRTLSLLPTGQIVRPSSSHLS